MHQEEQIRIRERKTKLVEYWCSTDCVKVIYLWTSTNGHFGSLLKTINRHLGVQFRLDYFGCWKLKTHIWVLESLFRNVGCLGYWFPWELGAFCMINESRSLGLIYTTNQCAHNCWHREGKTHILLYNFQFILSSFGNLINSFFCCHLSTA